MPKLGVEFLGQYGTFSVLSIHSFVHSSVWPFICFLQFIRDKSRSNQESLRVNKIHQINSRDSIFNLSAEIRNKTIRAWLLRSKKSHLVLPINIHCRRGLSKCINGPPEMKIQVIVDLNLKVSSVNATILLISLGAMTPIKPNCQFSLSISHLDPLSL